MKKNVTVKKDNPNCKTYAEIAKIMTEGGDRMNHNSVRNHITKGFTKIIKSISDNYELNYSDDNIKRIAQSEAFQTSIIELMKRENNEIKH